MNFENSMNFLNLDVVHLKIKVNILENEIKLLKGTVKEKNLNNDLLSFVCFLLTKQVMFKESGMLARQFLADFCEESKITDNTIEEEYKKYRNSILEAEIMNNALEEKQDILLRYRSTQSENR